MMEPVRTLTIFQRQPDPLRFSPDQVIFERGKAADYAYGILEGEVEVLFDGNVVEVLKAGEVFGIGALIQKECRPYTAIAKTNCKLAYLDQQRFLFAVQETPMFALEIIRVYSERLLRLESSLQPALKS